MTIAILSTVLHHIAYATRARRDGLTRTLVQKVFQNVQTHPLVVIIAYAVAHVWG